LQARPFDRNGALVVAELKRAEQLQVESVHPRPESLILPHEVSSKHYKNFCGGCNLDENLREQSVCSADESKPATGIVCSELWQIHGLSGLVFACQSSGLWRNMMA